MPSHVGAASAPPTATIWNWLPLVVLVGAIFAAYSPAWHGALLWDDDDHITPVALRSAQGLYRIWFDVGATLQHYPVLHSAFWLQHKLWGDAMTGYHLVNIAMHSLAAVLLLMTLRRLAVPCALLAAAMFALHPVQVESVAWITELKNTLSAVFYFAATILYLRFDRTRRPTHYLLAAGVFVLALLSKTVTGTLPIALLIVLWWKRGHLDLRRDVAPLAPLLVLGVGAGLATAWWEREFNRTSQAAFDLTVIERTLIAGRAIVFYLGKLFWPANLTFSYPRWHIDAAAWWQYSFPLGVGTALAAAWSLRRWSRAPLAGLLFFCVTVGPTLGFFNLYTFRYTFVADHYQYLACIGILALVVAGLAYVAARWRVDPAMRALAGLLIVALLGTLSWRQSHLYVDSDTLYAATIERNPSSWLAHLNLGTDLQRRGRLEDAAAHYRQALAIESGSHEAHLNLGLALQKMGLHQEAAVELQTALRIRPDVAEAHHVLGVCWQSLGRLDDAIREFRIALSLRPAYADAQLNLGATLEAQGRLQEAVQAYSESVRLDPAAADTHYRLANVCLRLGRRDEAIAQYGQAIARDGSVAEYHNNLAVALEQAGRHDEALRKYLDALRLRPDSARIENNVGAVLLRLGRFDEAAARFERALLLEPGYAPARENLARAKARVSRN